MITWLQNVSNSGVSGGDVDGSFGGCGSWGVVLLDVEGVMVLGVMVLAMLKVLLFVFIQTEYLSYQSLLH